MASRLICRLFSTPRCKALRWKWQFTLAGVRCDFWYWKEGIGRYHSFKMCVCVCVCVYYLSMANIKKNTIKLKFIPLAGIFRIPCRVLGAEQKSKDVKDLTPQ